MKFKGLYRHQGILLAILCVLCNLCFVLVSPRFDYFDEGSALYAARQIAAGDVLYRDQLYYKMPLSYYLLGMVFKVTGSSLLVSRLVAALLGALIVVLFHRLAGAVAGPRIAWWAALAFYPWTIPMRNIYHNGWIAQFGMLLVLAAGFALARHPTTGRALWMGAMLGTTLLAKQTYTTFLAAACLLWILLPRRQGGPAEHDRGRLFMGMAGGAGLVIGVALLYFMVNGALRDFLYYTTIYPLTAPGFAAGIHLPFPFSEELIELAGFITGPLVFAITALVLVHRQAETRMTLVVLAGIAIYASIFPRPDFKHLVYTLHCGFLCAAWLLRRALEFLAARPNGLARRSGGAILVLLFAMPSASAAVRLIQHYREPVTALGLPSQRAVLVGWYDAQVIRRTVREIQRRTTPAAPVYVGPWAPNLYILGQRPNPTRIRMFAYGHFSQDRFQREIVNAIQATGTGLVIWVDHPVIHQLSGPRPENFAPQLRELLATRFTRVMTIGPFQLYERRSDPPSGGATGKPPRSTIS
ncbi:glycosyltransferase family 39 protein [bacterium]|nr:glycosyltransferase family 39 protein [candidate division CSSED10-310 bacterium]